MSTRPGIGLCYGSLRDVSAVELVRIGGANGFSALMLPPFPQAQPAEIAGFRALLRDNGIRRVVLDGVMAPLPRCAFVAEPRGWCSSERPPTTSCAPST